jgi:uncharacterized glyoxalase superfamily protein PhnB
MALQLEDSPAQITLRIAARPRYNRRSRSLDAAEWGGGDFTMGGSQQKVAPLTVMLTVKDMMKTIAFYRDTLGFTLSERWPDTDPPMWANLMLGEQAVMIGPSMSPDSPGCGDLEPEAKAYWKTSYEDFKKNKPGVGVILYLMVDDVDAYHDKVVTKGLRTTSKPKSQFYGIRDFWAEDPDGYRLMFYTPIKLASCQSCGMPMKDAAPGLMYCQYCTDEKGKLRPYEQVLEGTTTGYFMGMQKMARPQAEKAAKEHLGKMPAWRNKT